MKIVSSQFNKLCNDFIDDLLLNNPETATFAGVHIHDSKLNRYSDDDYSELIKMIKRYRNELSKIDKSSLTKSEQIDYLLLDHKLKEFEFEFDRVDFRTVTPSIYVPVGSIFILFQREYAPLEERVGKIISRLKEFPRLVKEGKHNLKNPPKLWTEMSINECVGALQFLETIPKLTKQITEKDSKLKSELSSALQIAFESTKEFIAFLKNDLINRSNGEFEVGEYAFNFYLSNNNFLPLNSNDLLEIGYKEFENTIKEINKLAHKINSNISANEIFEELKKEHPKASELISEYKQKVLLAKKFVEEKDIVSIPPDDGLKVLETPVFNRLIITGAAYLSPPPLSNDRVGHFFVTPIDESLPLEKQEMQLRSHSYYWIQITALHEGYPGHHLQLLHSKQHKSKLRGMCATSVFVEGWALYCEEIMYELGFYSDKARLIQLNKKLWRDARVIIDVSLHTKKMSIDDAVKLFVEKVHIEPDKALNEVKRYTQNPTQPMSYTIGMLEIMKIRKEQEEKLKDKFSLKEFHNKLLSAGSIAPSLVKQEVF